MTNQDIMIQILHEVTGKPKKEVRRMVKAVRSALKERGRGFDKERPAAEAEELLAKLRTEKEGILAWLVSGAVEANLERMRTSNTTH